MTKEERQIRDENIVKDILAEKTNKELYDKYGLKKTAIQRIAKKAGITRIGNAVRIEKVEGGILSDNEPTIEDLQEENDNLKDTLADYQERILALEATVKELKAESAHIGHASIDVLDNKCSKDFVINIKKCGDDPEQILVCTYNEALNILMKYNPKLDEDYIGKMLSTYDQKTERKLGGRTTIIPNHGQQFRNLNDDVSNWKDAYQKLNKRIDDLENRL